jgi:hypothetical protein
VVTGTFRKERNHGLRALHVSVAGEVSCLRVTSGHPVWSVTRGAWIGAGELVPGEALAAWRGEPVAVLANLPEANTATWNLEVENEHVYRVGPAGILVHNTCPTPKELFEGGGGVKSAPIHRVGGSAPSNLALKLSEAELQPPGISVLQGGTAGEAAAQMRAAYPNATRLHAQASTVGISTASRIEGAGFQVMPDPSKRFPNHARITHPDGADGFNDRNLQRLSEAFDDTTGH